MDELAVVIDSVGFSYTPNQPVLRDVSLHCPKGQIVALLGANGCGKSTLLNILLGRLNPHHGSIHVLGKKVEAQCQKLNHIIGYMPQDIALNAHLDIEETFFYFARVNHVRDREFVLKRIQNYLQMLGLTNAKQFVWQLSGGQKRLLSLGVTLIYEPKILLLDEPTVGVDSLIRRDIWTHLNQICQQNNVSVIITTHYIDEAKQSNLVGFIKDGRLLAEQSPLSLMRHLECATLEEVFYKLCLQQNTAKRAQLEASSDYFWYNSCQNGDYEEERKSGSKEQSEQEGSSSSSNATLQLSTAQLRKSAAEVAHHKQQYCSRYLFNVEHVQALACREWTLFRANLTSFVLLIVIPLVTIMLFQSSYGRTPQNVPVAIVNEDRGFNATIGRISDLYLKAFNTSMVKMNFFSSEQVAYESVLRGRNVIALAFRANFSSAFISRYSSNGVLSYEGLQDEEHQQQVLRDSNIRQYIDVSDTLNARYLNRSVLMAFHRMVEEFGVRSGMNPYIFSTPIQMEQIYYGSLDPNLQDLFQAGIIIVVLMAIAVLMTSLRIVNTRNDGCLERDLNQGVKPIELLLTYQIAPLGPILVQVLATLFFAFCILGIRLDGSFWEAYVLVFVTTYQGIFIGTLVSVFCRSQISALIVSFSIMVIMFFTGGILWPVEGMPRIIQRVFLVNPIMLPIRSLRCIMLRGWSATASFTVAIGYITTVSTSLVLFIVEFVLFHLSVRSVK